jgi:farnesyl-diphosphate farnesyltransferase
LPHSSGSRDLETRILKGVSRSFYLTLRLLPAPMRGAASLGYLLARASDTLADTEAIAAPARLEALETFRAAVAGDSPDWTASFISQVPDARERLLLEKVDLLLQWLRALPAAEARLVREVVEIIIGGQSLDLQRFAHASGAAPVALADDAELEDYTWRVAGCVGAFWTKLGHLTLGDRFSNADPDELLAMGIDYGKGLQLVNILRDLPRDLAAGRCYLPVADTSDRAELMAAHARWLARGEAWAGQGIAYAKSLPSRRLRAASLLPALLALETLDLLKAGTWESLQTRVKVPRRRVYALLFKAFAS